MTEDKENGFFELFKSWLENRIESPFILAFAFSWLVINRDLMFFLIIYEGSDKYTLLENWNFSKQADFFGLFHTSNPYCRNIILPLLYSGFFSVFLNPVSLCISGLRYHLSSQSNGFASSGKSKYENMAKSNALIVQIEILKKEEKAIDKSINEAQKHLDEVKAELLQRNDLNKDLKKVDLYDYVMKSVRANKKALTHNLKPKNSNEFSTATSSIEVEFPNESREELSFLEFIEKLMRFDFEFTNSLAMGDVQIRIGSNGLNGKLFVVTEIQNFQV